MEVGAFLSAVFQPIAAQYFLDFFIDLILDFMIFYRSASGVDIIFISGTSPRVMMDRNQQVRAPCIGQIRSFLQGKENVRVPGHFGIDDIGSVQFLVDHQGELQVKIFFRKTVSERA